MRSLIAVTLFISAALAQSQTDPVFDPTATQGPIVTDGDSGLTGSPACVNACVSISRQVLQCDDLTDTGIIQCICPSAEAREQVATCNACIGDLGGVTETETRALDLLNSGCNDYSGDDSSSTGTQTSTSTSSTQSSSTGAPASSSGGENSTPASSSGFRANAHVVAATFSFAVLVGLALKI